MIKFANYKCLSFLNSTLVLEKTDTVTVYGPVYTFYDKGSNKWKIDAAIFRKSSESIFIPEIITGSEIERRKSLQVCFRRRLYFLSIESLKSFLKITEKDSFENCRSHSLVPREERTIIYK